VKIEKIEECSLNNNEDQNHIRRKKYEAEWRGGRRRRRG
jgi:hypothetical protein